jgi:hypothetical protein
MKCYHEDDISASVTTISLADAMLKVCEFHCIDAFSAGNMLQASSSARPVTVMDGTVHCEDDVPVLDIDKVIADWFTLKAKLIQAQYPDSSFTAMIVCNAGRSKTTTVDYRFNLNYEDETRGSVAEPTFNEFLRRVEWALVNKAKVLSIGHSPIEQS